MLPTPTEKLLMNPIGFLAECLLSKWMRSMKNRSVTNNILSSLNTIKGIKPESEIYKHNIADAKEKLKKQPELMDSIIRYVTLAANGDEKASQLLSVIDENGYLRIACIDIILSSSKG